MKDCELQSAKTLLVTMTATRPCVLRFGVYEYIPYAIDTLVYGLIQLFKTSVVLPIWMEFLE